MDMARQGVPHSLASSNKDEGNQGALSAEGARRPTPDSQRAARGSRTRGMSMILVVRLSLALGPLNVTVALPG